MSSPPTTLLARFVFELELRNYSRKTIKVYRWWLLDYLRCTRGSHPRASGVDGIRGYCHALGERGVSRSGVDQAIVSTRQTASPQATARV